MIQVNGLKKAFDGFVALNGVDMHVEKGDQKSTRLNSSHSRKSRMPSSA